MMPPTPRETLLEEETVVLRAQNGALRLENERLKVDAMARKLFGKSSEKLDPAQLQMVFAALESEPPDADEAKKPDASGGAGCGPEADAGSPAKRRKRTLDEILEGLPLSEVIVDPPQVVAEPEAWFCIGAEETRLIDYTPGRFACQKIIRRKYVRKDARHLPPLTASLHTLQERCIATPRLLAHTASQHFELHLPYYRIEQAYARLGVPLSRQTLCGWMGMAHEACALVVAQIGRDVFADGYVQIDETPVKYQDSQREGVCGTGYLWVIYNPARNVCLFAWRTGRGAACLESIVPHGWHGLIQCDGHSAYEAFARSAPRAGSIGLSGCLAHARRKFFEAKDEGEDPQWVLAQMQQLYQIEARLREARAGPEQTHAMRQGQSVPIMERIKERLDHLHSSRKHLPRSLTGEALTYARNQWAKLGVFLDDGRVQIDSNLVENAIRPTAIGKKNYLFMGDAQSGARAATFYTLIGNAHRAGLNAEAYLTDLFKRLPTETTKTVHRLTPHAWAAEQAAKHQALAQAATSAVLA